jgi:putative colanic acid biosynthesis acetyltransferase WcaF
VNSLSVGAGPVGFSASIGAKGRIRIRRGPSRIDKLRRGVWTAAWLLLYRPSPVLFHAWRCGLLRLFGAKVGRGARPYPSARIWAPWNLTMGDFSCLASEVDCYNVASVIVGEKAIVSQKTYICTASHDYQSRTFDLVEGAVVIGAHAWVAAGAFIGPGVRIGDGAVLGARSVALDDIGEWIVAAGHPARPLKKRPRP